MLIVVLVHTQGFKGLSMLHLHPIPFYLYVLSYLILLLSSFIQKPYVCVCLCVCLCTTFPETRRGHPVL